MLWRVSYTNLLWLCKYVESVGTGMVPAHARIQWNHACVCVSKCLCTCDTAVISKVVCGCMKRRPDCMSPSMKDLHLPHMRVHVKPQTHSLSSSVARCCVATQTWIIITKLSLIFNCFWQYKMIIWCIFSQYAPCQTYVPSKLVSHILFLATVQWDVSLLHPLKTFTTERKDENLLLKPQYG